MAKILALDTSSEACSVALLQGERLDQIHELVPRQHTRKILPMVQQLLAEAGLSLSQLDGIGFGAGPGSFTGLRITAGVAQGLALGAELPLLPVSTLAALAEQAHAEQQAERVLAALDARMGELYWGAYRLQDGVMQPLVGDRVCPPAAASAGDEGAHRDWYGIGSGWHLVDQLPESLRRQVAGFDAEQQPRAAYMARLAARDFAAGLGQSPETAQPVYLRDEVAWKKSNHRQ